MSFPARLYINGTLLMGIVLLSIQLESLINRFELLQTTSTLLIFSLLAVVAQLLKIEGKTERTSHQMSWFIYGLAAALYDAPGMIFVVVIAHLVEWAWRRYVWYIQAFNIASYAVSISITSLALERLGGGSLSTSFVSYGWLISTPILFTLLNHTLIGTVIWLARGENYRTSGAFHLHGLAIDALAFGAGLVAHRLWVIDPILVFIIAAPLYLAFRGLRTPDLEREAHSDPKTGLFNVRYFRSQLEQKIDLAKRRKRKLVVVMADCDQLRQINNSYGHIAGDNVLQTIAEIMSKTIRKHDCAARFGGDEFALLLPDVTIEQAITIVESIREQIENRRLEVATCNLVITTTASFGLASYENEEQSSEDLIHNADQALYRAKEHGRNRIYFYRAGAIRPSST